MTCNIISPNCYLAKVDLKNAYRSVNICESNYKYTGLKWCFKGESHPTYLCDTKLPFGAAKSPMIFQRLLKCICNIMHALYDGTVIVYIDYVLVIEDTYDKCMSTFNNLLVIFKEIRFYFPKRPSGAPLHSLSKVYDVPEGFVNPPPILRLIIAYFAVAEGWLLLDIG